MTLLGIECSGPTGSVALLCEPDGVAEETFGEGMIHGVAVAPAVERLLGAAGLRAGDLDGIAVGLGPGSWTGTRVGVAFAKMLAVAAGVPVVGVSSLRAMAADAPGNGPVVCARDGRRDTVYLAVFDPAPDGPVARGPTELLPLSAVPARLPPAALVIGDAVMRYPDLLSGEERVFGERSLFDARAAQIARLGRRALLQAGASDPHDLAPFYLRPSEAEERMGRERER